MNNLEFDRFYDDVSEEDIMFYSLKYPQCDYKVEYNAALQTNLINYDEPDSWPAFYKSEFDGTLRVGIFTSIQTINLAYINYNKE